ncbi:LppP/LprE family lipoprotein [Nocardia sp. NPDC005366]|uniref:LppP/LprE family lipoprotein n=1 Tax=Nocardia sp. NPDC005366 TaxID=3156878 RepID=UPI0033BF1F39
MNVKLSAVVTIAASVMVGVAGCGGDSQPSTGTSTGSAITTSHPVPTATRTTAAGTPSASVEEPAPGGTSKPESSSAETTPESTSKSESPAAEPAPEGSGHGLCFDVNSALAASSVARLDTPPGGAWVIQGASEDPIAAGCSGVLSWMTVEWPGIHPGTHILFFTGGKYLGTASAKPYAYTTVLGKTRDTVSVQYRWPKPEDALCCPQGGPSTVTFTLNGTTVQANGQFPPN